MKKYQAMNSVLIKCRIALLIAFMLISFCSTLIAAYHFSSSTVTNEQSGITAKAVRAWYQNTHDAIRVTLTKEGVPFDAPLKKLQFLVASIDDGTKNDAYTHYKLKRIGPGEYTTTCWVSIRQEDMVVLLYDKYSFYLKSIGY